MTETATVSPPPSEGDATAARPRNRMRWVRLLIPIGVVVLLLGFTTVAAVIEAPHPSSETFLSPNGGDEHGGSRLQGLLTEQGVSVERFTTAQDAFTRASEGDTTLFLPATQFFNYEDMRMLRSVATASNLRIVAVQPEREFLADIGLRKSESRIATKTVAPTSGDGEACELSAALDAGDAAIFRTRYEPLGGDEWNACYGGSLMGYEGVDTSYFVAGSPDVFSNEFIGQDGNAQLATGLLGANSSVVWLDQHEDTPQPQRSDEEEEPQSHNESPSRRPIQYPEAGEPAPIYSALPSWFWAAMIGALLVGVMVALSKGRRLGAPITEPLPVTAPAAEKVYGRARLYRRAHAYEQSLRALRAGALRRIRQPLRLSSQATEAEVVAAVSHRIGWPEPDIESILYSRIANDEQELLEITQAIDALVAAVENASPQGRNT
ncbi:MAG TPA: hypothetical protein H9902_13555 [Candidatus Stackebrandtia faecavium]|nr:hypothetical protein [Candidatus Stackebrandtia faecavium]